MPGNVLEAMVTQEEIIKGVEKAFNKSPEGYAELMKPLLSK